MEISGKLELDATHLKDLILHSRYNHNSDAVVYVQPSRFESILRGIRDLNSLYVEGFVERMCEEYDYFTFVSSDIGDKNNNMYTIVKTYTVKDEIGRCKDCNCMDGRSINGKTGVCFYKEHITNNYTTKIPEL